LLPSRISVLPFLVFAVGVIGTYGVLYLKRTEEGRVDEIESVKPRDSGAAAYLVTYVVPLALPTNNWRDWVAVLLFLMLVAVLYLRSGMDYVNPMLALIGYHLYEATLRDDKVVWLVTRLKVRPKDQVNTVNMIGDIWIAKSRINGS
jgi:hypothetical protein